MPRLLRINLTTIVNLDQVALIAFSPDREDELERLDFHLTTGDIPGASGPEAGGLWRSLCGEAAGPERAQCPRCGDTDPCCRHCGEVLP